MTARPNTDLLLRAAAHANDAVHHLLACARLDVLLDQAEGDPLGNIMSAAQTAIEAWPGWERHEHLRQLHGALTRAMEREAT